MMYFYFVVGLPFRNWTEACESRDFRLELP